jgi:hypothetical protein
MYLSGLSHEDEYRQNDIVRKFCWASKKLEAWMQHVLREKFFLIVDGYPSFKSMTKLLEFPDIPRDEFL